MANKKISELTALATPALGDLIEVEDISAAAGSKSKKSTFQQVIDSTDIVTETGTQTLTNKTINDAAGSSISANVIHSLVRNVSGGTLTAGTPVYNDGFNVGQGIIQVDKADADDVTKMPVIGLIESDILNNASGDLIEAGFLGSLDTSSFSAQDELYISTTAGVLTATRPTGATELVQLVCEVLRSHASMGEVDIFDTGRSNDIPNFLDDSFTRIAATGDTTKLLDFSVVGVTTGTTRTWTVPDTNIDFGSRAEQGLQTIWVPTTAMRPTVTNGCAAIATVETTAGNLDYHPLDFDASADEHAQFTVMFPKSFNDGTVTYQGVWTVDAAVSTGIALGLQARALVDSGSIDQNWQSPIIVTDDAQGTAEDVFVTAVSTAMTIIGVHADGDLTFFRVFRDVSDGNDDMTQDMRLLGIRFFYTTDAVNDA